MQTPVAITVEILSAKVRHNGEPVFVIISLDGERFRTSYSDKLVWNETCELAVNDVKSQLTIKLKSRSGGYGKFKTPVFKIPTSKSEEPAHLPLEDANKRPAGELVMHFYVSKWKGESVEPQRERASPVVASEGMSLRKSRMQELGSMQSVRQVPPRARARAAAAASASSPAFNRHLSIDTADESGSGTDSEAPSTPGSDTFRGKIMRRVRSMSANKHTQPKLFSASADLVQPRIAFNPAPCPDTPPAAVPIPLTL